MVNQLFQLVSFNRFLQLNQIYFACNVSLFIKLPPILTGEFDRKHFYGDFARLS